MISSTPLSRTLSLSVLVLLTGSLSTHAADETIALEGAAGPAALAVNLLDAQAQELRSIEGDTIFPSTPINLVDPLSKKKVSKVLIGPAFRARTSGAGYDYYRYVTFYDVSIRKERIYALPIQREQCEDRSEAFATLTHSYNFTAAVNAAASIEGLGLSASISESRTFSNTRNLRATGGVIAEHVPYFEKQDWKGRTFIQTYNSKTKKTAFITKQQRASDPFISKIFPILAHGAYPMRFSIRDADWTFLIERNILSSCESKTSFE